LLRVWRGEIAKRGGVDAVASATTNDKEIARHTLSPSGGRRDSLAFFVAPPRRCSASPFVVASRNQSRRAGHKRYRISGSQLFLILFLIGLGGGWLADFLLGITQIRMAEKCGRQQYHVGQENLRHYLSQHLFRHILLRHGPRVFGWTLGALVLAQIGLGQWRMGEFIENHPAAALAIGALIGMIPESGPSLAVVMLFANGVLPFSVLLANSIVQDGHGMLPLLSHSLKDSIWIKLLNFLIGIAVGGGISLLGV
jgi:hypothetical protein